MTSHIIREVYVVIYSERSLEIKEAPYKKPHCFKSPISLAHDDEILHPDPTWRLEIHNLEKYTASHTLDDPESLTFLVKTLSGARTGTHPNGEQQVWLCGWADNAVDAARLMKEEAEIGGKGSGPSPPYSGWNWVGGSGGPLMGGTHPRRETMSALQYQVSRVVVREQ